MQNTSERPVCHRAEDLVTYLYGEATAEEARDFAVHMHQCEACRAEFGVFSQVHDSILVWRNEALGSFATQPQVSPIAAAVAPVTGSVQPEPRLSAVAALRQFFTVSPLWLRGATAFAGLFLCALIVFVVTRAWQPPAQMASDKKYSEQEFQQAVQKEVTTQVAKRVEENGGQPTAPDKEVRPQPQLAERRSRPRTRPANRLTGAERQQLAADLGLIPGREDELPFVLPEEPDHE